MRKLHTYPVPLKVFVIIATASGVKMSGLDILAI